MISEDNALDVLGQNPRINRLYTHITLCFEVPDVQHSAVVERLTRACHTLPAHFPWTAGHVVLDDGIYKIRNISCSIPLTVKTCAWNVTCVQLKNVGFPLSMLEESVIAPCKTLTPETPKHANLSVCLLQANFLSGGLLLTFAGQHGAMDMNGLVQLMSLFAQACRHESFTPEQLALGNNRPIDLLSKIVQSECTDLTQSKHIASPSEANKTDTQNPTTATKDATSSRHDSAGSGSRSRKSEAATIATQIAPNMPQERLQQPEKLVWTTFAFSGTALADLKASSQSPDTEGGFVSTDDVLSALVWLAITRARTSTAAHIPMTTTLSRNVDMRRYLSLPANYPGLVVHATTSQKAVETLLQQPVCQIASELRSALDAHLLIRDFVSKIEGITQGRDNAVHRVLPDFEVRLSSWSKENSYSLDLGFGRPVCVRRPAFYEGARAGLVYFLPKSLDGAIDVALCLTESSAATLRADSDLLQYGSCVD